MRWTEKEVEILKALHKNNIGFDDICRVFSSRSNDSIRHKCVNLGLEIKKEREIDYDLYRQLMNCEEV